VGASEGFLGWVAYLGAANAGVPLSIIVKQYVTSACVYSDSCRPTILPPCLGCKGC
jgi:sugar phosphate permease